MSLIRLNSGFQLSFHVSACWDLDYIPSRLPVPTSTYFMFLFYVLIWSTATATRSSMQTSWHFWTSSCLLRWTVVELEGDPLIFLSFLGSLFSPGFYSMGLFQADMWRVPSLLIWSPELWSCILPSNPFTILNSPILLTAAKAAFCLHSPRVFPFFVRVSRTSLLTVFLCHLEWEVDTDVLQDPPALCMSQVGWSVPQVIQDCEYKATSSFEQETGLGISHVLTGLSYDPVMLVHFLDYHMVICVSCGERLFICKRWLHLRAVCHLCGATHRSGSVSAPQDDLQMNCVCMATFWRWEGLKGRLLWGVTSSFPHVWQSQCQLAPGQTHCWPSLTQLDMVIMPLWQHI